MGGVMTSTKMRLISSVSFIMIFLECCRCSKKPLLSIQFGSGFVKIDSLISLAVFHIII